MATNIHGFETVMEVTIYCAVRAGNIGKIKV